MPDSTIFSSTIDAYATNATTSGSWNDAQGSATTDGGSWFNNSVQYQYAVYNGNFGSRGSNDYRCYRSYFVFDVSSESGTVESADILIYMDNLGTASGLSARAILVEATAYQSIGGGVEDHGNVFSSGTTWHNDISNAVPISTTAGYHTFTINSDGITLINSKIGSGTVTVGLVGHWNDYLEQIPTGGGDYSKFLVRYADWLGTGSAPKMEITYAAVTANATFFGANF